ncbi:uncharacterized protein LOC132601558 [Lycium barbarum]|uniref:uncharacterized protein LOC132601558 n=1 Tax=Lycium barbarum TaxID=112863 RepID=UPI00293E89AC|nr:uncharacterized protein LOC132601558 [Lycium barbarum]
MLAFTSATNKGPNKIKTTPIKPFSFLSLSLSRFLGPPLSKPIHNLEHQSEEPIIEDDDDDDEDEDDEDDKDEDDAEGAWLAYIQRRIQDLKFPGAMRHSINLGFVFSGFDSGYSSFPMKHLFIAIYIREKHKTSNNITNIINIHHSFTIVLDEVSSSENDQ